MTTRGGLGTLTPSGTEPMGPGPPHLDMGLLDRLPGRQRSHAAPERPGDPGPTPTVRTVPTELPRPDRFDPFLADRELRAAYRVMVDGDWRRLERFLEVSPKGWLFGSIITGDVVGMETVVFERWVDFKQSPRSRVFLANALIRDAFAAYDLHRMYHEIGTDGRPSGNGSAALVDDGTLDDVHDPAEPTIDGFLSEADDQFVTRLSAAEELLYEVISERPAMTDPWVGLLISGRGLQVDLDELRERFENAHSRDPFRADACRQYLQGLTKKWGGSNVASFDLARWLQEATPAASPAREALPMAHVERGILQYGSSGLGTYLAQPEVMAELSNGLLAFLQASPSETPAEALGVLNAYTLALHVGTPTAADLMVETLARIANRPTEWPWSLFSDDVAAVFAEIQADQLRAASRLG